MAPPPAVHHRPSVFPLFCASLLRLFYAGGIRISYPGFACHAARQYPGAGAILRILTVCLFPLPLFVTVERTIMKYVVTALICLSALSAQAHEYSKLLKDHKYAEAEKAIAAKLAQEPKNADALVGKADLILRQGQEARQDEGIKLTEQCVAAHPQNSQCHEIMGSLYSMKAASGGMMSALSNAGKGREALQKAVELDPKNYNAAQFLLMFYLQAPGIAGGGMDKAQQLQQNVAKINKEAGNLFAARIALKEEKFAQAESMAHATNVAGNEDLEDIQIGVLASVASQYRDQKKFTDSERLLRDVIKRAPNNIGGYALLGRTLAAQGKHDEAISMFQKALALEERAAFHYRIALSQQAMGDKANAAQGFEKALALKNGALDKKQREDAQQQLKALKA
jgi:tetratricopeptide (TPR) repeat protein